MEDLGMKLTLLLFLLISFRKTFPSMSPKLRNRDPVDNNVPSPSNQEVYTSRG